jgi:hypothetical protein
MKILNYFPVIAAVFLISFLISFSGISYAQDEIAQATIMDGEITLEIPKASIKTIVADTVLPTICNDGMGLFHVEKICIKDKTKKPDFYIKGAANTTVIYPEGLTETEYLELQEQERRMNEQYHYEQDKQWIQENLWIDLEGIIRGINTAPVF